MILNSAQIQELFEVIDYFHVLFIGQNVGTTVLSPYDKYILKKNGVDINTLTGSKLEEAYKFGILSSALQNSKKIKGLNYEDFKAFLKAGGAVPLTKAQNYAIDALKQQAYGDIKGLGNRVQQQFNQMVVTVDQKQRIKMQQTIRDSAAEVMSKRGTVGQLSSLLGHKTKDWARDFDRISDYLMHSCYQHGIAQTLIEKYGEDVEIYYDVYDEACDHCVRTYLTDGIGSQPKVFKLKDVLANGNNIGVKAKDYKPSVDPLHPWCRCTMNYKPANTIWNAFKRIWEVARNNYGVKRKSKINISIQ